MSDAVNRSGTLVGSVLESAGYIYQSSILDSLQDAFTDEVGALVYLFGICLMIFQFTFQQRANSFMWLLIGPPLFFAVTTVREPIEYSRWSFGSSERDQAQVQKGVSDVTGSQQGEARVSKAFKSYVEMISASVTSLVDTIVENADSKDSREDLWFLVKGELYGAMTTMKQEDPGLIRLIHHSVLGDCRKVVAAAGEVDDPLARFDASGEAPTIANQLMAYGSILVPSRLKAKEIYEQQLHTRHLLNDGLAERYIRENFRDRMGGLTPVMLTFSCQEIWAMTFESIMKKANLHEENLMEKARELGVEEGALKNLFEQASGKQGSGPLLNSRESLSSGSAQTIARVIAKFALRNETRVPDKGSVLANFVGRNDIRQLRSKQQGYHSYVEQARLGAEEWSERERLIHVASSLPYYQGMALYFLGMTFPFFAFLLLIPGKLGGFTLWFLLWLWIKSWDVGLAVVIQLDSILWSFFTIQKRGIGNEEELSSDLQLALISLKTMDPSFQMAGYYTILGVCLLSIPPISAQLILGSMRGGASAISAGVSRYSDFHSDAVLAGVEQSAIQRLNFDSQLLKQEFSSRYHEAYTSGAAGSESYGQSNLSKPGGIQNVQYMSRSNSNGQYQKAEAAAREMRRKGAISSFKGGENFLGGRPNGALARAASSGAAIAIAGGRLQTKSADISRERIGKERGLEQDRAYWDADISEASYDIHERLAIMQGIPVPWTNFVGDDSSQKELDKAIFEYKGALGMSSESMKVINSMIKEAVKLSGVAIDTYNNSGLSESELLQRELQKMNPQNKKKLMTKLNELVSAAGGIAAFGVTGAGLSHHVMSSTPEAANDFSKFIPEIFKDAGAQRAFLGVPEGLEYTGPIEEKDKWFHQGSIVIDTPVGPDRKESGRSNAIINTHRKVGGIINNNNN